MFATDDTIAAIATPAGRGALAVIRISGPAALSIVHTLVGSTTPLQPRYATVVRVRDRSAAGIARVSDQAIAIFYPHPASYTGDDLVELSLHGSAAVVQGVLAAAVTHGARLAQPGEFTLRAFLSGKLDLVQAEAVADLIDAVTPLQASAAFDQLNGTLTTAIGAIESRLFDLMARLEASLDFPDEGYRFVEPAATADAITEIRDRIRTLLAHSARGRLLREGATVALAGVPNVGKSSLFNALLNTNRAIVTAVPGTTRDLLTERVDIRGMALRLVDTAGIRVSGDEVEQEGMARTRGAMSAADLILVVLDGSRALTAEDRDLVQGSAGSRRVVVINKIDLPRAWRPAGELDGHAWVEVSAATRHGLDELVARVMVELAGTDREDEAPLVTNVRHADLLTRAAAALTHALDAIRLSSSTVPEEFILIDLQEAAAFLQEIVGRRSTEDLLRHIFTRFCIGK